MLKIAILGKAGSGKNTVASIIAHDILKLKQEEFKISAFANKIKEITSLMFPGCSQEALYGSSELRQNQLISDLDDIERPTAIKTTARQVAFDIGKLGRSYDPYFWVAHTALEFINLPDSIKLYTIADLRFTEEYEWVRANGFTVCRVKRDNLIKVNDISETEQDKLPDNMFDIIIENNTTTDDLKKNLKVLMDSHFCNNKTYLQVRNAAG